jgi:Trypsin-like peptidase domain
MNDRTELSRRLDDCTVLILLPGPALAGGSGFFVAPGLVLTCAHVLGKRNRVTIGDRVTVHWQKADYPATVADARPADKGAENLWAAPDLALVGLDDPPAGHPCAWLDDTPVKQEAHLYAAGFQAIYTEQPRLGNAITIYTGPLPLDDHHALMRMKGDELPEGMSGGPVLDIVRGAVCGVVKTQRREDAPQGGLAIPVAEIRTAFPETWRKNAAWQVADMPVATVDLAFHERQLKALRDALSLIYPGIFKYRDVQVSRLDAARKALLAVDPVIEMANVVADNAAGRRRQNLQLIAQLLKKYRESVSRELIALESVNSKGAALELCDDLTRDSALLLDQYRQAIEYGT